MSDVHVHLRLELAPQVTALGRRDQRALRAHAATPVGQPELLTRLRICGFTPLNEAAEQVLHHRRGPSKSFCAHRHWEVSYHPISYWGANTECPAESKQTRQREYVPNIRITGFCLRRIARSVRNLLREDTVETRCAGSIVFNCGNPLSIGKDSKRHFVSKTLTHQASARECHLCQVPWVFISEPLLTICESCRKSHWMAHQLRTQSLILGTTGRRPGL